jgi:hypothetical protein
MRLRFFTKTFAQIASQLRILGYVIKHEAIRKNHMINHMIFS